MWPSLHPMATTGCTGCHAMQVGATSLSHRSLLFNQIAQLLTIVAEEDHLGLDGDRH